MKYVVRSYLNCKRCGLCTTRRHIVFGRGKVPATILFVGEAPGKSEDLTGESFVGPSGRLLNAAIDLACRMIDATIPPSYYITNVVACRPTDSLLGDNRQPTHEEAWRCNERLQSTYADVSPKRVVLLGQIAKTYCLKSWPEATCLPHPAYLLRLGGLDSPAFTAFARDLSSVFKEVQ